MKMRCPFLHGPTVPVALFVFCLPHAGLAQGDAATVGPEGEVRLVGSVVDRRTGEPLSSAAIDLFLPQAGAEAVWSGRSDARGRFRTEPVPLGVYQIDVQRLPFSPLSHPLVLPEAGIVDVEVEMVRVDYALEPVVVSARRQSRLERSGFFERREVGIGYFVTREDIESSAALRVSDLLRRIPGTRIVPRGGIERPVVRLRGGCTPRFVVDGVMLAGPVVIDDLVSTMDVEAVEVYHGASAPMRYVGQTTCGVVMLWTRDPGTSEGSPLSWRRVVVALSLGLLAFFGTR